MINDINNTNVEVNNIESKYTWLIAKVNENGRYDNIELHERRSDMNKRNIILSNNHTSVTPG